MMTTSSASAPQRSLSTCPFGVFSFFLGVIGSGLAKISTMELIKETVDKEEQNDLEELYFLWDEAIQLYEMEEFPGDYEVGAIFPLKCGDSLV